MWRFVAAVVVVILGLPGCRESGAAARDQEEKAERALSPGISLKRADLQRILFVATHPYNKFDDDSDPTHKNWEMVINDYRLEYMDRNNTFNDSYFRARGSSEPDDIQSI